MKALCSIGSGPHESLLEISRPTFASCAERHGYELITSTRRTDPGSCAASSCRSSSECAT